MKFLRDFVLDFVRNKLGLGGRRMQMRTGHYGPPLRGYNLDDELVDRRSSYHAKIQMISKIGAVRAHTTPRRLEGL